MSANITNLLQSVSTTQNGFEAFYIMVATKNCHVVKRPHHRCHCAI